MDLLRFGPDALDSRDVEGPAVQGGGDSVAEERGGNGLAPASSLSEHQQSGSGRGDGQRWRVVVGVTHGCPQQARDALNSLLWFRAKDEAKSRHERRALPAAVARLEKEYVDELTVLDTRYRVVRAEEYAAINAHGAIESPRPTDPEPLTPDWSPGASARSRQIDDDSVSPPRKALDKPDPAQGPRGSLGDCNELRSLGWGRDMNRRLFGLACTLILAASASVTGCGRYSPCPGAGQRPEGLSTKDLVGAYQSAVGSLTLSDDGTFTTLGWPASLEEATGDPQSRTGSGTWKLIPAGGSDWPVSFTFHKISGYWDSDVNGGYYGDGLYVSGSRKNPHLYGYVGDPDSCELDTFTLNR